MLWSSLFRRVLKMSVSILPSCPRHSPTALCPNLQCRRVGRFHLCLRALRWPSTKSHYHSAGATAYYASTKIFPLTALLPPAAHGVLRVRNRRRRLPASFLPAVVP